jgi:tRNA(Ile)-lysidine synthase
MANLKKPSKNPKRIAVALSGGLDSVVLLHAVVHSYPNTSIYAFHIHHGLQAGADRWLDFSEKYAQQLRVQFDFRLLHLKSSSNIEAQARAARYESLFDLCDQHSITDLLLAHHQNDQVETVLLQLLRGSGVAGLSAMPAQREAISPQGLRIRVWRPLLEESRDSLLAYAKKQRLKWVEDPSNLDMKYRRNAIRNDIVPKLVAIQPGALANIARSARVLSEAQYLLNQLAEIHLKAIEKHEGLFISPLLQLKTKDTAAANNVLRYWLKKNNLAMPTQERLQAWWADLEKIKTQSKANSQLVWHHDRNHIRLWRNRLRLVKPSSQSVDLDSNTVRGQWHFRPVPLASKQLGIPLVLYRQAVANRTLEFRMRSGGERFKIKPKGPSRSLKNLYQECAVPPWQRHIPLLYLDGQLLAVEGVGVSCDFLVNQGQRVWPHWE